MSFAMSPGYTNTTLSRRARAWAKRRRVIRSQPTLSTGQSAPLLLAQALHKRAAGRTWLPLRTIFDSDVERLDETPAFLGEQKYDLAGACSESANPR